MSLDNLPFHKLVLLVHRDHGLWMSHEDVNYSESLQFTIIHTSRKIFHTAHNLQNNFCSQYCSLCLFFKFLSKYKKKVTLPKIIGKHLN